MRLTVQLYRTVVSGATPEQAHRLYDLLSVRHPAPERIEAFVLGQWDGYAHHYSAKTQSFPSGLLFKVLAFLVAQGIPHEVDDQRVCPLSKPPEVPDAFPLLDRMLGEIVLRPYQVGSIRACLEKGRGLLELGTNAGKTECLSGLFKALALPSLYIVSGKTLAHQARERIAMRLGTSVGFVGDGYWQPNLRGVTVAVVNTLHTRKATKEGKAFLQAMHVLAVDEAHNAPVDSYRDVLLACPAYYRFGVTGTLPDQPYFRYRLMAHFGGVIYQIGNASLIAQGVSEKPTIEVVRVENPQNRRTYQEALDKDIAKGRELRAALLSRVKEAREKGQTILILTLRQRHCDEIAETLRERGYDAESIHGEDDSFRREDVIGRLKSGDLPIVASTVILRTGVDIPAINVLIYLIGGKDSKGVRQAIGRVLRKKHDGGEAIFVDMVPVGNWHFAKHLKARLEVYRREGFNVVIRSMVCR